VQISKGLVQPYKSLSLTFSAPGSLNLTWMPQLSRINGLADDQLIVILYNEEQDVFQFFEDAGARADGSATLEIPADYEGQTVHAYMFYVNPQGNRQSISTYVGPTTL
jgi:hypothetical protein